jgi:hypothetical protein
MKSKKQNPMPRVVLTDADGNVDVIGPTLTEALSQAAAQRLALAFCDAFTSALGVRPTRALTLDIKRRARVIVAETLGEVEGQIRDGFAKIVTNQRQGDKNRLTADDKRRARERAIKEFHNRRATGRKVNLTVIYEAMGVNAKTARALIHEMEDAGEWPPPPRQDIVQKRTA